MNQHKGLHKELIPLNEYVYCDAVFDCDAVFVFILEGTKIIRGWYVQK